MMRSFAKIMPSQKTMSFLSLALLLASCFKGPGLFKKDGEGASVTLSGTNDNGVTTSTFSNPSATQTLSVSDTSSMIYGSSVTFPSGSLEINTIVSLQEGSGVASSSKLKQIGLASAGKVTSAGPALVVNSSSKKNSAFTLEIPVSSSSSLWLGTDPFEKLIIVFTGEDKSTGETITGIIPRSEILKISGGKATFPAKYFGSYQSAYTTNLVQEAKVVASETSYLTKIEEQKLPDIVWRLDRPTKDLSTREASFRVKVTGFNKIKACTIFYYATKTSAPFTSSYSDDEALLARLKDAYSFVYTPTNDAEHSVLASVECLDDHGRFSESSLSEATTIAKKLAQAPTATISGAPSGNDASAALNVKVAGVNVVTYKYKFGVTASTSCAVSSGYSSSIPVATSITDSLSSISAGSSLTLCVIGANSDDVWQGYTSATSASWNKASALSATGVPTGTSNASSLTLTFAGSGFNNYKYKLGSSSTTNCSVSSGYSATMPIANSLTESMSSVVDGSVTLCAVGQDIGGNWQPYSDAYTASWTKDTTLPTITAIGLDVDTYFNTSIAPVALTWSGTDVVTLAIYASSNCTGTPSEFSVAAGSTAVTANWPHSGASSTVASAKLIDAAGNPSTCESSTTKTFDNTPPTVGAITAPNGTWYSLYRTPPLTWSSFSDPGSGIDHYEVAIESSSGTIVRNFADVGSSSSAQFSDLVLVAGNAYKAAIRAVDMAGNVSSEALSGAWTAQLGYSEEGFAKGTNIDAYDHHGGAVAIDMTTGFMVLGVPGESSNVGVVQATGSANNSVSGSGAAYVYRIDPSTKVWSLHRFLKPTTPVAYDNFGASVAISGNTIIIGAPGNDVGAADSGAAYVFFYDGTTWVQQGVLKAQTPIAAANFGYAVDIDDTANKAIVGAPGGGTGKAYLFSRTSNTWSAPTTISAVNAGTGDGFGTAVAISGNRVAVGAPNEASNQITITNGSTASSNNSTTNAGAVYIYDATTTITQQAYIKAKNAYIDGYFGSSIALDANTLIVGSPGEDSSSAVIVAGTYGATDHAAPAAGAAYVYTYQSSMWSQQAYIKPSNADVDHQFGNAVSFDNEFAVIGAKAETGSLNTVQNTSTITLSTGSVDTGAAYVFKRSNSTTWSQLSYLKASNSDPYDNFGASVSISLDFVAVGAPNESSDKLDITTSSTSNNNVNQAGAAYLFRK